MRPGQQNRRGRGRNNGRKGGGQNPLSRNFESNGPDVKIRGNASHIAEKYMALARDAMSSGDQVMAENYLQHAEHYNRIIMAAQAQYQEQMGQRRAEFGGEAGDQGQGEGGFEGDDEGYDEQPFTGDQQPRTEFRQPEMPRGFEPQPGMSARQDHNEHRPHRGEGRSYEGRQGGGEGRFGGDNQGQGGGRHNNEGRGQGDGRNQQGEFRGRRNRHRHDNNNRFRQNQGGGMPANPADIAAMAAANGSGFQDSDRRRGGDRDRSEERSGGEAGQDE